MCYTIIIKHVLISGKVQGVWYRASTKQKAHELEIKGWVQNTSDGKVEAVFQGKDDNVKEMIKWCYQGSPLSNVEKVDVIDSSNDLNFDEFKIKD